MGLFGVLYAPVRLGLDFLRNTDLSAADARYGALTPAQWGMFLVFVGGVALLATRDFKGHRPWALDGEPDQERRAREGLAQEIADGAEQA